MTWPCGKWMLHRHFVPRLGGLQDFYRTTEFVQDAVQFASVSFLAARSR
jgi:hypothetical protein